MLARATVSELAYDRPGWRVLCRGLGLQIRAMCRALAGTDLLHGCLIGMQYALTQDLFAQGVKQQRL